MYRAKLDVHLAANSVALPDVSEAALLGVQIHALRGARLAVRLASQWVVRHKQTQSL
jgi:hypothetical protein